MDQRVKAITYSPDQQLQQQAAISSMDQYNLLQAHAEENYQSYWANLASELLIWETPFSKVLNESNAPFFRWFEDGRLNVSFNCLDKHLASQPDKTAIIFEADDGRTEYVSYRDLYQRVCKMANGLKSLGMNNGDRVIIYLPMSIEAVVAMQACARLGLIHSVVFGGFSSKSLAERIVDAGARAIITADGQRRGGKATPLKSAVDEALAAESAHKVEYVIVQKRTGEDIARHDRDIDWDTLTQQQPNHCEPVWVEAEHPLFILYTSGSTGKPKGVQHASAGYLLHAYNTMRWTFDIKPDDVFWCTADVGWITGHTYVAYGPLAAGATQVIFEGVPTYPDASRFWKIIEQYGVSIFYTAPTAIRALIKVGGHLPKQHQLGSLRLLGTVGEPINPSAWEWFYQEVGQSRCPIVDTFWQTETGGHVITPLPGATPLVPGSCTLPFPGLFPEVVDETGHDLPFGTSGQLVIKRPWPSMIRTIWNDDERFRKTYFPEELGGKLYLAGDGAVRDPETGYFTITGRIDDVLNVSGHRLGTMEIESALVAHPLVAEAAVVGKPHDIKGESIVAYITLKSQRPTGEASSQLATELRQWVAKEIGPIAKPDDIRFGDNLPKTRSGKIMRRLLRSLARNEEIKADLSTLDNPAILEQLRQPIN